GLTQISDDFHARILDQGPSDVTPPWLKRPSSRFFLLDPVGRAPHHEMRSSICYFNTVNSFANSANSGHGDRNRRPDNAALSAGTRSDASRVFSTNPIAPIWKASRA